MRALTSLTGLTIVLLSACTREPPPKPLPFQAVTDIHQTMELILDPAADVLWGSAGTIISAEGRQELAPTTDEGWLEVERAAAILAETGNLLMIPGRAAGDDWVEYSRGLITAGTVALQAARDRDADALFDAGGQVYQVCLACHNQYWVEVDPDSE
jgi:hypothetical protein